MRCNPLVLLAFCAAAGAAPGPRKPHKPYGFSGFETYKLDRTIYELVSCDVDGDGLKDLLVANNSKARIEVLLRRKQPVAPRDEAGEKLPNDLVYDRFYERKEILTEKVIYSVAPGDFNGDKKLDVAYYGKPPELVVAFGDGKGGFPDSVSFPIRDGTATTDGLAAGDLNGDGRDDLVLLSEKATQILYQSEKGVLREPVKLPHSVEGIRGVYVADLDGDGRKDLVQMTASSSRSLRVNFQQPGGGLGAELSFATKPWRELEVADLDPAPGSELVAVQRSSGVVRALRLASKPAKHYLGTIEIHAFEQTRGGRARSMAIGDLNGDGRQDLVVTEPGIAQVAVYLQDAQGRFASRKLFPSLSNSDAVRVADLDGDGRAEVVVLSSSERAVGIASFKQGRLPFPELMDLPGVPKALDTGDLNGDGRADLVVVTELEKKEGKYKKKAFLFFEQAEKGGLPKQATRRVEEATSQAPSDLMLLDIDHDGRRDLLLFESYGPMRIWRAKPDGSFDDLSRKGNDYRSGLVNKISRGAVNAGDIDGDEKPELLVATKNYARALALAGSGKLKVMDQANGATPRSQIKGVVALDLDGDGKAEIALFDRDKQAVTLLQRNKAGVFEVMANLEVGKLEYQAMFARDCNGDGRKDLVLFGKNRFGVLYAQGRDHELKELFTFESRIRDAYLSTFAVGDLNGDGEKDLLILDQRNRALQVLSYDPQKGFKPRIRWKIYEKKLHERSRRRGPDVKGLLINDLNGDGRNDVALLIHDLLIVYLQ